MPDSEDETITLSAHAAQALAEFREERDAYEAKFAKLQAGDDGSEKPLSMDAFTEDWNESQFWTQDGTVLTRIIHDLANYKYSEETAATLAAQLMEGSTKETTIGVVSAPSVFVALRNMTQARCEVDKARLVLLEHDERFNVFTEFVRYDFQHPFQLPAVLKGSLDRIICDPPYLSSDCQTKVALTARWLLKPSTVGSCPPRVIVCTGERMKHIVTKLYRTLGVRCTTFEPKHAKGLGNEFYCYANFESSKWAWL